MTLLFLRRLLSLKTSFFPCFYVELFSCRTSFYFPLICTTVLLQGLQFFTSVTNRGLYSGCSSSIPSLKKDDLDCRHPCYIVHGYYMSVNVSCGLEKINQVLCTLCLFRIKVGNYHQIQKGESSSSLVKHGILKGVF